MTSVILCTSSYDMTIKFWEATSALCCHTINIQESQVNRLAITHKAPLHLAAATFRDIKLYHLASSTQTPLVGTFQGHKGNVLGILFDDEDDVMITCSEDKTIKIWDTRRFKLMKDIVCESIVNSIALFPDQVLLFSGEESGSLCVWNIEKDVKKMTEMKVNEPITSVSVSPDAELVICGTISGLVHIFQITGDTIETQSENGEDIFTQIENVDLVPIKTIKAHDNYILKVLISPDGDLFATTSADKTIKLWTINHEKPDQMFSLSQTLKGHNKWVWDCVFSSDSAYLVSASSDGTSKLWDLGKGEAIRTYKGHQKAVVAVYLHDQATQS